MEGNTPVFAGATPNFGGGVPMNEKGGDSSTTYATLTEGNIVIGGKKVTAAELGVNTDAATAHRAIEAMPNAELQLANQQAMANAMGTVVATSKQIAGDIGNQAMRDLENSYLSTLSDEEKNRFKSQSAEGKSNELAARFPYSYSDAVAQQQKWGIGSQNGRALEAVTTLLVGVVSGQGGGQVAANALAPYAAQLIGEKFDTNHGSDPNAALQLLSHALLGALLAEANGGSAGNGAVAAAGGELAAKYLADALYGVDPDKLDEQQKQSVLALSQAVGALAGASAGQGLVGAAQGAAIAGNSVENNRLLRKDEIARIKEISDGDAAREAELTAAACALVKCSEGFAEGSAERAQWAAIQEIGARPEAQQDRDWLKARVLASYIYTAGNGMSVDAKLFDYGVADYFLDWSSRNQVSTRALGGLQLVGGSLQTAGGVLLLSTCETGIGCVAAGYTIASGFDNAVAGSSTLRYGVTFPTLGGQILQAAGLSPQVAEILYAGTQIGAASLASTGTAGLAPAAKNLPDPRLSYTEAPFITRGLEVTDEVLRTPQAQALVAEYIRNGASNDAALLYARSALASGTSVPLPLTAGQGYELIKLVPKNAYSAAGSDSILGHSPFFVTKDEYLKISKMTSLEAADYLGLPAQQGIRGAHLGFDAYSMTPKPGQSPVIFKSEVAPISQGGYSARGGAEQMVVPNRGQWTDPNTSKIGEINGGI